MEISWIKPEQIVEFEFIQLEDESIQVDELRKEWEIIKSENIEVSSLRCKASIFLDKLEYLKNNNNNDKIEKFISELTYVGKNTQVSFSSEEIYDKILGGWNGRAAGCLLGKPIEKYSQNIIKEILLSNNSWPLNNYITAKGIPDDILKKYPWNRHSGNESLRENIECMTEDDDLNYTMLNLKIAEKYGKHFKTENVAQEWLELLPVLSTFTAERIAYKNLLSIRKLENVPLYRNPYREWIGAMIRADLWGWISVGNPLQAVTFAFNDAALSHTSNGVIGEMFISAAIALSFSINDPLEVINEAMNYIPQDSNIYHAANFGVQVGKEITDWEKVVKELQKEYGKYYWVHSINNTALITASIAFAKGDFEKSICSAVMGGWDTDSDGASVGSIMGTVLGYSKLPSKWIKPLNNKIRSSLKGFDGVKIDELAKRTFNITNRINNNSGELEK